MTEFAARSSPFGVVRVSRYSAEEVPIPKMNKRPARRSWLMVIWVAIVVLSAAPGPVSAQTGGLLLAAHTEAAKAGKLGQSAYTAGKFDVYLVEMRRAFAARPDHPRIIYNTASALAMNGKTDEALALVERLAAMGLSMPVEQDADFKSLAGQERFRAACARLAMNAKPAGSSVPSLVIPGKQLILEGLTYDTSSRTWFASSVRERKIFRIDSAGAATVYADRSAGLWSVFGMTIDAKRRLLWVATGAVPQTEGYTAADAGKSALVGFDLQTGKAVHRFEPGDGKPHTLGDVALGPGGEIYASDGTGGAILVGRPGAMTLEVLVPEGELLSPQGMAVTPDGARLLVADYSLGLCAVDLKTRAVTRVETPETVCLLGIDGLTVHGRHLVITQNGINPHRVSRVRMSDGLKKVEGLEVLEVGNPTFDEPTLGIVVDGWYHYIANSQWSKINAKGEIEPADAFRDTIVLKLKL